MAYSSRTYTPGSSTTTFALTTSGGSPIGYIQESDIKVTVNNVVFTNAASGSNTYQFSGTNTVEQPSGGNIVLNTGVTGTVILERTTAIQSATVTYTAGSTLTADDLNNADNQIRFGLQEFSDDYAALTTGTGSLPNLGAFLGGSDNWVSNDAKAATTAAIDGRVDSKIDTALTTDVSGGDGVTIVDNSPGAGQIRIDLDADIATLRNMQSGAATALAALTSTEVAILDGASLTTTELNYVDGVTSAIQTQLDNKQALDADLTQLSGCQAGAAAALAALTQAEVQILDGATVTTAELNVLDGIPGTLTATELGYVDGVTSSIQTQINSKQTTTTTLTDIAALTPTDSNIIVGNGSTWVAESGGIARTSLGAQTLAADLTTLSSCQSGGAAALAALTATEIQILDGATPTTTELNYVSGVSSAIQTQLAAKQPLDSELTTLAGMQAATASTLAGGTALGATISEINSVCENRAGQTTITDDDSKIPTSGAVVDYVAAQIAPIGGLEVIATEVAFPNSQPASGVVISISDAGGVVVNGSGVSTTGRTVGSSTVTINGFPSSLYSETLAAGVGLMVSSTGSSQTYTYHKLLAKEGDVKQLSDDINDFNERYRVSNGAPSGTDHAGDLYYDTGSDKMLVRNAANNAWEEVQSIGNFYISTLSPAFNGSLEDFTVSNAPSNAQQLLISINGILQKPNSGTSRPSEGFALNGSTVLFSDPPATGSDYFVVVIGSAVNIGAPSNNTVGNNQLMSGAVDNAKVAANAAIAQSKLSLSITNSEVNASAAIAGSKLADDSITEVKLDIHNAPSGTDKYLKYTSNGMEWATVPPGVGGATGVDFNDDVKARWGTDNDIEIYHSSGQSYIQNSTGNFRIDADNLRLRSKTGSEAFISATVDAAVELYHDNIKTFETTANGIKVVAPENNHARIYMWADDGDDGPDKWEIMATTQGQLRFYHGDSSENTIVLNGDGAVELYYDNSKKLDTTASGIDITGTVQCDQLTLLDNEQIRLGLGADFQVFHDGNHTYLDNYVGNVIFRKDNNETLLKLIEDGAVELYHNNIKKLNTASDGIDVSGDVDIAAGAIFLEDNYKLHCGTDDDLQAWHNGSNAFIFNNTGDFNIRGDALYLKNKDDDETYIKCINDAQVELYHDNTKQCETTSNGLAFPSGKGISFAATGGPTNGSDTSELLDDYEEGTFTLVLSDTSGNNATSGGTGHYTKIGRWVNCWGQITFGDAGTSIGGSHCAIKGWPFAVGSHSSNDIPVWIWNNGTDIYEDGYASVSTDSGGTVWGLYVHGYNFANSISGSNMGNNGRISLGFSYEAT